MNEAYYLRNYIVPLFHSEYKFAFVYIEVILRNWHVDWDLEAEEEEEWIYLIDRITIKVNLNTRVSKILIEWQKRS